MIVENPKDLKYTKKHEWVKIEGNTAVIGITDLAQSLLGDVVFVELPEIGSEVKAEESIASVESVKAVSNVFAPVSGKVIEVNSMLDDSSDLINSDAFGEGWVVKLELSDATELDNLMSVEDYGKFVVEGE